MVKIVRDKDKIQELLTRRVDEVLVRSHLQKELNSGRKLKIKLGIDPTSPKLHLGHSVVLGKLREFQKLGHEAILVIGDFTAKIGDPSGRTKERKKLTNAAIEKNMRTYKIQAGKILDLDKLTIKYNSDWLGSLEIPGFLELASKATYTQLLKRRDYKKRLLTGSDLSVLEMLYPLLQGYDSVALKADVELGGIDQKLNLLMGRQIQKRFGQEPQDILTTKLLVGLDGKAKMSKSENNYIGLLESANDMFARVMSLPDNLILGYFKLCTSVPIEEITEFTRLLSGNKLTPIDLKKRLAREIVTTYHSRTAAFNAEKVFERVVQEKGIPDKIKNVKLKIKNITILDLLLKIELAPSKSEAKRLIQQGGVSVNEKRIMNPQAIIKIKAGMIVRAGKRKYLRITR